MDRVIEYLKKADYVKVSWWTAIASDVVYLITAIWCVYQYFKEDFSDTDRPDIIDYLMERQQEFLPFFVGYFLLILASLLLYLSYIYEKNKVLKNFMMLSGMIQVYFWICMALELLVNIEWMNNIIQLFLTALMLPVCITGIVSIIVFLVNEKCRSTELLLLGSIFIHYAGLLILTASAICYGIKKILEFVYAPGEYTVLEEKDEYGNVIGRWIKER